jgi:selenocysteine lyase/cysteine desulfurase
VDLARVSAAVHRNSGVNPPLDRPLFVIDGTQSIGAMPFDATVIRPDVVSDCRILVHALQLASTCLLAC